MRLSWALVVLLAGCAGGSAEVLDASTLDAARSSPDAAEPETPRDAGADATMPDDAALTDAQSVEPDAAREPIVFGDVPAPSDRTCAPPRAVTRGTTAAFTLGGQAAWFHDEGHEAGFFHTYDALVACTGASPRKVHVFLPRDYETSARRYPVLYLNDGQTAFFTDNPVGKTWDYAGVISELRRCGEIEDLVVVAPHPLDRDREYTHQEFLAGRSCCGVPDYTTYVADCLRGFVERNYRVDSGPERTAIAGSSHGGLAAFWIATARPDVFGAAAAVSSSFWVGLDGRLDGLVSDTPLTESPLYAHALPTLADRERRPRLWLDWGLVREGGVHNSIIERLATVRGREMATVLVEAHGYARDAELAAYEDPDGGHDEDTWRTRLPAILRWLFPAR